MTYDELLEKIDEIEEFAWKGNPITFRRASYDALREVVELAQQVDAPTLDSQSYLLGWNSAMDAVIQAIEKELG